jgi:hypothetical protein
MNTSTCESPDISISPEQFALGVIALYVLNFGGLALGGIVTIFMLPIGGLLLQEFGVVQVDPTVGIEPIIFITVIVMACLIAVAIVGYLFYWGTKSIVRGRPLCAGVFLVILVVLHVLWIQLMWRTNPFALNWFNLALACYSTTLTVVRWKRLFP